MWYNGHHMAVSDAAAALRQNRETSSVEIWHDLYLYVTLKMVIFGKQKNNRQWEYKACSDQQHTDPTN